VPAAAGKTGAEFLTGRTSAVAALAVRYGDGGGRGGHYTLYTIALAVAALSVAALVVTALAVPALAVAALPVAALSVAALIVTALAVAALAVRYGDGGGRGGHYTLI
jgi:hypothetical protein